MNSHSLIQFDQKEFRRTLANFPTGVVAITTIDEEDCPLAMIIGSFSSISLDPPLVGFWADQKSGRQAKIRKSGRFCVNILAADQEDLCRQIAAKGGERMKGITWTPGEDGCPEIEDVIATIRCEVTMVTPVGDHDLVVGSVSGFTVKSGRTPLLFFRGEFGDYFSTAAKLLDRLMEWH